MSEAIFDRAAAQVRDHRRGRRFQRHRPPRRAAEQPIGVGQFRRQHHGVGGESLAFVGDHEAHSLPAAGESANR